MTTPVDIDRYGRLHVERDGCDFVRETLEEVADGLFYVGAGLLAARRARGKGAK